MPQLCVRAVKVEDLLAVAEEAAVEEGVGDEEHPDDHEHVEDLTEEELPEVDVVAVQHAPETTIVQGYSIEKRLSHHAKRVMPKI